MYEILIYHTESRKEPYTEWIISLDTVTAARIDARITRLRETGNFGICEPVGEGIFELKFDFGPGYLRLLCKIEILFDITLWWR